MLIRVGKRDQMWDRKIRKDFREKENKFKFREGRKKEGDNEL